MTTNLIDISSYISSLTPTEATSGLLLKYNFDLVTQPVFYNSVKYSSSYYSPIINQVFNQPEAPIGGNKIPNCDFMTFMFPTSNVIQFQKNNDLLSNTYSTECIHFTRVCPIRVVSDKNYAYSIVIECSSNSIQPLLIIIPVEYSSDTTKINADLNNLIKYSQSSPSSIMSQPPEQISNIYVNNIIPSRTFYYFNQTISNSSNGCEIIVFKDPIYTSYNQGTENPTQVDIATFSSITTLDKPTTSINFVLPVLPSGSSNIFLSKDFASNNPLIVENDIYIDCSVVTDTATSKTSTIIKLKKPKNTGLFILWIIIITISVGLIYMWVFGSSNTTIRSSPRTVNTTSNS
jgi:hypothetical protein